MREKREKNYKSGFTLTEIIIAVVLLALLLIIAIPNIIKFYNNARLDAFVDEARNIYNAIQPSYQNDFLAQSIKADKYCESESSTTRKLQIKKPNNLYYDIELTENGEITKFHISKGNLTLVLNGTNVEVSHIKRENIQQELNYTIDCDGSSGVYCNVSYLPCIVVPKFEYTVTSGTEGA